MLGTTTRRASSWSGRFTFGSLWAAYVGPAGHSDPHAHVAIQVVIAAEPRGQVAVTATRRLTGRALIIRPLTRHSLDANGHIWSLYLEASSPVGRWLRPSLEAQPVVAVPLKLMSLLERDDGPAAWLKKVELSAGLGLPALDPRLQQALGQLLAAPGSLRIDAAARSAGVSKARLRTLARAQLGVPLATWLLWQKLERAGRRLQWRGARRGRAGRRILRPTPFRPNDATNVRHDAQRGRGRLEVTRALHSRRAFRGRARSIHVTNSRDPSTPLPACLRAHLFPRHHRARAPHRCVRGEPAVGVDQIVSIS